MPHNDASLIYSSLTTRRSSYPRWVLIKSSPLPVFIRRSHFGNEVFSLLLAANCTLSVPPLVNDIVESLTWLLVEAPFPLRVCYRGISLTLLLVCDHRDSAHIHPLDAHEKIAMIAMSNVMDAFSPRFYPNAHDVLKSYIRSRWGEGISFVGFKNLLLECYDFMQDVSNGIVFFCIWNFILLFDPSYPLFNNYV
jgi:hypothetical protein